MPTLNLHKGNVTKVYPQHLAATLYKEMSWFSSQILPNTCQFLHILLWFADTEPTLWANKRTMRYASTHTGSHGNHSGWCPLCFAATAASSMSHLMPIWISYCTDHWNLRWQPFLPRGRLGAIKASVRKAGVNEVEIVRMFNISSTNWHYTINFDTHMPPTDPNWNHEVWRSHDPKWLP